MIVYVENPNKRKAVYDILNIFYQKDQIIFDKDKASIFVGDDFLLLDGLEFFYEDNLSLKAKLYKFLCEKTSYRSPWGILTGSKPSKLLKKHSPEEIRKKYLLSEEKLKTLIEVDKVQKQETFNDKDFNLYINIPFCQTRCDYCSYPTIVGNKEDKSLYVKNLLREIDKVKLAPKLDTIYIGGGTPSFLSYDDLSLLLERISEKFSFREFSFEAGREDCLDYKKLKILKEYGVNRISLNPQTFTKSVIEKTGRIQNLPNLIDLYYKAKDMGFIVNMDFIIGLFGETRHSFRDNFKYLRDLKPDNITFHALAQKVGSKYHEKNVLGSKKDSLLIAEDIEKFCKENNYKPYYLYRQKNIISNLENIAYEKDHTASRYNILINEEMENVIGFGMNANSKLMDGEKYRNPRNLRDYYKNINSTIEEKNKLIEEFNKKSSF
ncbi:MAG: radical SAM protein [Peptoniphilaceae bacterium]|nr:radical SAM protein [Peptoniphilaceae bacterium]MDY6018836.1 radical SAM protein [Anaerococcus sp.]